jgi:glycosyltransferase involved in cell wall biosynthesis
MIKLHLGLGLRTKWHAYRARNKPGVMPDEAIEAREIARLFREGKAPLGPKADHNKAQIDVAFIVSQFSPGSGGHMTMANLVRGLEKRGHKVSLWVDDIGQRFTDPPETVLANLREHFGPFDARTEFGFEAWTGADVIVATSWQTVARACSLPNVAARAYLVQDHEPEFFGTSVQQHYADDSYRHGLYPITASEWLADVMKQNYGLKATWFHLGIESDRYRPVPGVERNENAVIFYARGWTPRRAVPVALVALSELKKRRPQTELWGFGHPGAVKLDVPVRSMGVLPASELPALYSSGGVGLVLSMTNYSLVAQEMLACGLPCVELDTPSIVKAFGRDGPVDMAPLEPLAIADALERLLDDPKLREQRRQAAKALVAERTWEAAAERFEAGLRAALKSRAGA